jgi:hypothetical protein
MKFALALSLFIAISTASILDDPLAGFADDQGLEVDFESSESLSESLEIEDVSRRPSNGIDR